ncbi:sigma 54-interacting transcriptional regulator [Trinickia mobilis]|uniref:sigma 54-interacting transcriptional regulator n=1 Tax=Trinickia mobilis TaxID=2816356 RepID=UPI001A8CDAC0|nr:sigma 54-interacting transcriptional regulator [Trinickia mobilis]
MRKIVPWPTLNALLIKHGEWDRANTTPEELSTSLRLYLVKTWFDLDSATTSDVICDSAACRAFIGGGLGGAWVPDPFVLEILSSWSSNGELMAGIDDIVSSSLRENGLFVRQGQIVEPRVMQGEAAETIAAPRRIGGARMSSAKPPAATPLAEWAARCGLAADKLEELAGLPIDIVIEGETGVGKDTLAKLLHEASARTGPFVAINCAALPEHLAEAELFGAEAGAFTDARQRRAGRIEVAHGGTLYLDEIDSMPLALQAKMLRALQERGCERLGSTQFIKSEFRVITSTKVPLDKLVEAGRFRSDLYYRLRVVQLHIPSLRERMQEICPLFVKLCDQYARQLGKTPAPISLAVESQLLAHHWPGNIRELHAAACRYVLGLSLFDDEDGPPDDTISLSLRELVHAFEKRLIERALEATEGATQRASNLLKLPQKTLYYRMRKLGIDKSLAMDSACMRKESP